MLQRNAISKILDVGNSILSAAWPPHDRRYGTLGRLAGKFATSALRSDHVREHNGLKTFIASGAYRQALLMRMLTDWIGPRGWLQKISLRHTYTTFEGDLMRLSVG